MTIPLDHAIGRAAKKWLTRDRGRVWLNTARRQLTSNTESSPCAPLAPLSRPLSSGPLRNGQKAREFDESAEWVLVRPIARQDDHNICIARRLARIHCLNGYPRLRIVRKTRVAPFPSRSGIVESARQRAFHALYNDALPHARCCDVTIPLDNVIGRAAKTWLTRGRGRVWFNTARRQLTSNTESSPCAPLAPLSRPLSSGPLRNGQKAREFDESAVGSGTAYCSPGRSQHMHSSQTRTHSLPERLSAGANSSKNTCRAVSVPKRNRRGARQRAFHALYNGALPHARCCDVTIPLDNAIGRAAKTWLTRGRGRVWFNTARRQLTSNTESSPCAPLAPLSRPLSSGPLRNGQKAREFDESAERVLVRPIARQDDHNICIARRLARIHCLNGYPRLRIVRKTRVAPFPSRSGIVESARQRAFHALYNDALPHARCCDVTIPLDNAIGRAAK